MSISSNFPTSRPSLLLDFVNSGQMDPRVTFSRASGATWFNSAGVLVGVDFSSTSLTVGTGWQTLTLTATAGVDRNWIVGTSVQLIASTGTNTMTGVVVSYTASTQTLVVSVASVVGSGTYSTWRVSNLMPRFDYDPATLAARGFLIEEARTNLITSSAVLPAGVNVTITANTFVAPDGTTTGDQILDNATLGEHYSDSSFTPVAATNYTFSAFIKNIGASSSGFAALRLAGDFSAFVIVDLSTFTVATTGGPQYVSSSVQAINNGWYKVSVTGLSVSTTASVARVQVTDVANLSPYSGTGEGFAVWGRQLEAGAFSTSYIPTTTTALTRSADVASVNTLSPWYNSVSGTLYAEVGYQQNNPSSAQHAASFNDTTANNRWTASFTQTSSFGLALRNTSGAGLIQTQTANSATVGATNKIALAISTGASLVLNGGTVATNASYAAPTVTQLELGKQLAAGYFNGHLRRITYYPRRLSDAELQSITS